MRFDDHYDVSKFVLDELKNPENLKGSNTHSEYLKLVAALS